MDYNKILLSLEMIECELDDATNSLPDWGGNSDSRSNIDCAKDELYNLKDEIERAILDSKQPMGPDGLPLVHIEAGQYFSGDGEGRLKGEN